MRSSCVPCVRAAPTTHNPRKYNRHVRTIVHVAAEVDRGLLDRLEADERVDLRFKPANSESELVDAVSDVEVLVSRYHNPLTASVLASAPKLRLIVQGTSGLDNIDLDAAVIRQITVIGIPGENANAVAEYVLGCILMLTRTIPTYSAQMREQTWTREGCAANRELKSHALGIIGLGRVGSRVATLAAALGLRSSAFDPYLASKEIARRGATNSESLAQLLRTSTIITVHVPLNAETKAMIGPSELALLPRGAIVINAARGAVVDLDAVLLSLANNHLEGAAIDVFDEEPPRRSWPSDPRLILTPHVAGCSGDSKESIGERVYEHIDEYLEKRN